MGEGETFSMKLNRLALSCCLGAVLSCCFLFSFVHYRELCVSLAFLLLLIFSSYLSKKEKKKLDYIPFSIESSTNTMSRYLYLQHKHSFVCLFHQLEFSQ